MVLNDTGHAKNTDSHKLTWKLLGGGLHSVFEREKSRTNSLMPVVRYTRRQYRNEWYVCDCDSDCEWNDSGVKKKKIFCSLATATLPHRFCYEFCVPKEQIHPEIN